MQYDSTLRTIDVARIKTAIYFDLSEIFLRFDPTRKILKPTEVQVEYILERFLSYGFSTKSFVAICFEDSTFPFEQEDLQVASLPHA